MYAARLRRFIRTYYMRRAGSCFDMASRNHDSVSGRVVIGFEIQADGTVHDSSVVSNSTHIDTIGACLASQVGRWRLPPPPADNAPLAMSMPFSR